MNLIVILAERSEEPAESVYWTFQEEQAKKWIRERRVQHPNTVYTWHETAQLDTGQYILETIDVRTNREVFDE